MNSPCKCLIFILFFLLSSKFCVAKSPFTTQAIEIFDDSGNAVLGTIIFDKSVKSGQVESIYFSAPTDLVVDQKLNWSHWHKHDNLTEIHVALTSVEKEFSTYVSNLTSVKVLRIESCKFANQSLLPLGNMSGLKELHIDMSLDHPIRDWSFLNNMKSLRVLSLTGESVNARISEAFPFLENLRVISFCVSDKPAESVMPALMDLRNIQSIQIERLPEK